MGTVYLCIVIFLLCLAVFDLFVGVSNDAVNFLQSAIGAKVAKFRTVLIIASFGVVLGAIMSSGMMDIARHGLISPDHFTFEEVMTLFLAVMVTDVIVLDVFNTFGMPTSTTVSLVFELLGGAFILATLKMIGDDSLNYGVLLNSDKALEVIMGIFSSVIIAFVFGIIVMWLSRVVFTFNYRKHSRYSIAIFGGISFTVLSYFIFMKGLGKESLPAFRMARFHRPEYRYAALRHLRDFCHRDGVLASLPHQHLQTHCADGHLCFGNGFCWQ